MGSVGCAECHESKFNNVNQSPHAMFMTNTDLPDSKRGCEGCHGPGKIHQAENNAEVISFRKMDPKEASAACLRCHEKTLDQAHWKRTEHAQANVSGVDSHQIPPDRRQPHPLRQQTEHQGTLHPQRHRLDQWYVVHARGGFAR